MSPEPKGFDVYLEIGKKRAFASVPTWPGWCRGGKDESSALQALVDYSPRYARALSLERITFPLPVTPACLTVTDSYSECASADFGVPDQPIPQDALPITPVEQEFFQKLLSACWKAFENSVTSAAGHELRKGPRGGGRELQKIIAHVRDVENVYLRQLGGIPTANNLQGIQSQREEIIETLATAIRGELPACGPRGGIRWTPRYFVRRMAWHELDHAWEIEDRMI